MERMGTEKNQKYAAPILSSDKAMHMSTNKVNSSCLNSEEAAVRDSLCFSSAHNFQVVAIIGLWASMVQNGTKARKVL